MQHGLPWAVAGCPQRDKQVLGSGKLSLRVRALRPHRELGKRPDAVVQGATPVYIMYSSREGRQEPAVLLPSIYIIPLFEPFRHKRTIQRKYVFSVFVILTKKASIIYGNSILKKLSYPALLTKSRICDLYSMYYPISPKVYRAFTNRQIHWHV